MSSFDAGTPININDCDLKPSLIDRPHEIQGFTESSFLRAHVEITRLWRYVFDSRRPLSLGEKPLERMTEVEKDQWLKDCRERLKRDHLKCLSLCEPMQWVNLLLFLFETPFSALLCRISPSNIDLNLSRSQRYTCDLCF